MPLVNCTFCNATTWRKPSRLALYSAVKCSECFKGNNNAIYQNVAGEEWREVPGFEQYLLVSDFGNIKTKTRERLDGNIEKSKMLAQKIKKNGYLEIGVRINKKKKYFLVHRLVAATFIQKQEGLEFVNHKNFNKKDNRVDNLEWCTSSSNSIHAQKGGRCNNEEKHHKAKLNKQKVAYIRTTTEDISTLAKKFGVSESTIENVKARRTWKYFDIKEELK
jgi:hypothetical protein